VSISILVPFRSDGGERDRIWAWMRQRWTHAFPDAQIVVSDDGGKTGEPFNEGRAWNLCLEQAIGDTIVVTESEVAFNHRPVADAIKLSQYGQWFIPLRYYQLNPRHTMNLLSVDTPKVEISQPAAPDRLFHRTSLSPIWVLPRVALDTIVGFDERWQGWGWIDKATVAALDTLYRPHERFPGSVFHLHHERESATDCNPELTARYLGAQGNATEMRAIIAERAP
jgi:hypothetical protein